MSKKILVWRGNDIGHGQRGGVVHCGGHKIRMGTEVPKGLLSEEALKAFLAKKCIVEESVADDKKAVEVKPKKANKKSDKKTAAHLKKLQDALKHQRDLLFAQQNIIDDLAIDDEEARIQATETLVELQSLVEQAMIAESDAQQVYDDAAKALAAADAE